MGIIPMVYSTSLLYSWFSSRAQHHLSVHRWRLELFIASDRVSACLSKRIAHPFFVFFFLAFYSAQGSFIILFLREAAAGSSSRRVPALYSD